MPPRCRIAPRRCCSGVLAMHRIWRPARLELIQSLTSRSAEPHCGSEEHTSELQSLMRISYAVFCLKKKKKTNNNKTQSVYIRHIARIISLSNQPNYTNLTTIYKTFI